MIYIDDGRICMCHGRDKILSQRVEFHPGPFPLILEEESHAKFGRSIDHSSSLIIYFRTVALYMDNTFDIYIDDDRICMCHG